MLEALGVTTSALIMFELIYSFSVCADFSCDETDKGPPVQMHSLREFEQVRTCSV